MRRLSLVALLSFSLAVASLSLGCERQNGTQEPESAEETEQTETAEQTEETDQQEADETDQEQEGDRQEEAQNGEARTITLEPEGNQMQYATTELTATPGEQINLVFDNTATEAAMKHNVVLLNTDDTDTAQKIAQAGWKLPDQEYVPENDAIVAHTEMSDPGETVEMTFTAPEEPGEYLYICTYPGHYPSMKGTLVVEEK